MTKTEGFLTLMRPANLVTAAADILAGVAISGYFASGYQNVQQLLPVLLLSIGTIFLYGGGVVFNDVFDAELDSRERPERPIPSGLIPKAQAMFLGILLLVFGCIIALFVSFTSGFLALLIALSALVYDKYGKHQTIAGPINMGLCRGFNLLLGISIIPLAAVQYRLLAVVPIIYIASITMISRGEVFGGRKQTLYFAGVLYAIVIGLIGWFAYRNNHLVQALIFLAAFGLLIYRPLSVAIQEPIGPNIGKAVKAGVIGLILMNAAWAAAAGYPYMAIVIALLLPLSLKLGKMFAVT